VFSQSEIRQILKTSKLLKHRVLFATIYDCGLRISEVINLKITDVDFDRQLVHIRESKCKKDRYVPVSSVVLRGLNSYFNTSRPQEWLFEQPKQKIALEDIRRQILIHYTEDPTSNIKRMQVTLDRRLSVSGRFLFNRVPIQFFCVFHDIYFILSQDNF
jgi:integrase